MWIKDKLSGMFRKRQPKNADPQTREKDDALFEALGKNKKRKKRRILFTVLSITLVLAIGLTVGVGVLRKKVQQEFASASGQVLSHTVSAGSISTVVSGSGSLADVDLNSIAVPEGVEIVQVSVKANQTVRQGDILATVDMATVISAMADLQGKIEELDAQIRVAEEDSAATSVYAGVTGRVKAIFGQKGAEVADVMYEHGALAVLSLDGYMAVDIETSILSAGEKVAVQLSDGTELTGTVEQVVDNKATVLVTDDGPLYEDTVTVFDAQQTALGTGNLYIHSPLRITGFAGTISEVKTSANARVTDSTKLFALKDTGYSANYHALLRQRAQLEETLLELLTIQRDGAVLAKTDGSVYSVDHSEENTTAVATLSADEKMSVTISVDEADILSLQPGQTVTVTVSSVSEDSFRGTLTQINRTGASSGTYSAVVELEKETGMLSGMTASVSVRIQGVDNAVLIPVEALHKTRDGAYVYTSYDPELQEYGGKVDVVTGLENSTYVEIKSGLKAGDTVYYTEQQSNFGGGQMPNFGGGQMPNFGGNTGGRPGSSGRPSDGSSSGRPTGNFGSGRE